MKLVSLFAVSLLSTTAMADGIHFPTYELKSTSGLTKMADPLHVCEHKQAPSSYAYETHSYGKKFKGTIHIFSLEDVLCSQNEFHEIYKVVGHFYNASVDGKESCRGKVTFTAGGDVEVQADFEVEGGNGGLPCGHAGLKSRLTLLPMYE